MADFSSPYVPPPSSFAPETAPPAPHNVLRPLTMGEALDRIFFLFRSHFTGFLLLGAVPGVVGLIYNALSLAIFSRNLSMAHRLTAPAGILQAGLQLLAAISLMLAMVITEVAAADGVSRVYRGQDFSPKPSLQAGLQHPGRYTLIYLWKVWSAAWAPGICAACAAVAFASRHFALGGVLLVLVCGSLVYGVIAYIRNSLALPASMIEGLPARAAMRRSKRLVAGHKGRIFVLLLILAVCYFIVTMVAAPFTLYALHAHGAARVASLSGGMLLNILSSVILSPLLGIAFAVFYFDERVRREGFDIELLLEQAGRGSQAVPGE